MRFFKSPSCARMTTKDLYKQVRLEKEEEYKQKTANEYEYVAPEHGYDYALPSQYVPSHTVESSLQEIETIANALEPDSDVTGSFDEQLYLQNLNQKYKKRHQMRKSSPTLQRVPEYNDHHQSPRKSPSRSYHNNQERYEERDGQHLNGIGQYNERRYSPAHVESRDPKPAERYVERALKAMEFSDNDDDEQILRIPSPASPGIKRVPTAFSYHSEDSEVELELERSNSRYELMQHENIEYNNRKTNNHKGTTRRGDENRNKPEYKSGQVQKGTIWRNREDDEHAVMNNDRNRRMGLSKYESHLERGTSPSRLGYHHDDEYAQRRWRNSSPREEQYDDRDDGRFDGPRPDRTRRRSRSPYTRGRHRSTSRERQFNEVDHFPEEISFASLRERNPYLNQSPRTMEVKGKGKKKTRGFLGMIRDSVIGKTKTKKTEEKTYVEKRLPPPPPPPPLPPEIYASDAPGEYYNDRIPYQQNIGYGNRYRDAEPPACDTIDFPGVDSAPRNNYTYWRETEQQSPRRSRSRSPSHIYRARSRSPSPVNLLPRTSPQPDRRPRSRSPVNDVHLHMHQRTRSRSPGQQQGMAITRTRSNASAIPFETTRSNTPQLRFNPDPRRPVPIPDSMMKHHYNTASPHNNNNNYYYHPYNPNHYGGPIGGNKSWERRERNGWSPRNNGLGHARYQL